MFLSLFELDLWINFILFASEDPLVSLCLLFRNNLLSLFLVYVQKLKCVLEYAFLYIIVKRAVCCKRWRLVNFQQPRFKVFINHYVKSEDLKAH